MSVDRFGKPIVMGYSAVELVYLRACMQLPRGYRFHAFADLSEMLGRTFSAIQSAAYRLHAQDLAAFAASAPHLIPERSLPRKATIPPSELKQPLQSALMAGRASSKRVREIEA